MKKQSIHPNLSRGVFLVTWLIGIILLLLPTLFSGVSAARREVPSLFYNDTAWVKDDYYPSLGFSTGAMQDYWIPLSFFEEFDNIKVRRGPSKTITSFVISDTVTGKYLSFDIANNEYAQTERGTYRFVRTTLYSKERYLPMRDMCAYFGWSFEISEEWNSVRITDGGQKKTFEELLEKYRPIETEAPDTTAEEPDTGAETDIPGYNIYRSSVVYLTFEDIDDVYTPQILDALAAEGMPATFFVTGSQLTDYTDMVVRILSEGHSLGLHTMTGDEYDILTASELLSSFEKENDLLYALTKRKTRLVRLPEGSHSGVLHLNSQQKKRLSDAGYVLWDWNIEAMDTSTAYDADMVYRKIEEAMKISYYPVVRFHCSETAAEVLPRLLARIAEVPVITAKRITEATESVVFP